MLDVLPPEQRAANTAASRYLATLTSAHSRRAMTSSLQIVARLVCRFPALKDLRGRPKHVDLAAVPWAGVTPELALSARAALAARYRPASANRHLAALRGVLSEAGALNEELRKATKRISGSNLPDARTLSLNDLGALLGACERDTRPVKRRAVERAQRPAGLRDAAVLALIFSGLRRAEVCSLDLDAYQAGARIVRVEKAKGLKVRDVPLHEGACCALDAWIAMRGREPGPLVQALNKGGKPTGRLSANAVYRICQDRAAEAGVEKFAPHDARRYAAGAVLDVGAELSLTALYLGHSDVRTTARYDRRGLTRLRRAVEATSWPGA
jgi:integrase